jgi:hypothetical protein
VKYSHEVRAYLPGFGANELQRLREGFGLLTDAELRKWSGEPAFYASRAWAGLVQWVRRTPGSPAGTPRAKPTWPAGTNAPGRPPGRGPPRPVGAFRTFTACLSRPAPALCWAPSPPRQPNPWPAMPLQRRLRLGMPRLPPPLRPAPRGGRVPCPQPKAPAALVAPLVRSSRVSHVGRPPGGPDGSPGSRAGGVEQMIRERGRSQRQKMWKHWRALQG